MTEIVFLVESVDQYNLPFTLGDRIKSLSPEWIEHYQSEIINTYQSIVGNKISFLPYGEVENFDPNKKYYYFICIDLFNFDFSIYFQMLGKSKLKRLHDNNVPLYFAHDLETLPHLDFKTFVNKLEWLYNMRMVYSPVQNHIVFSTITQIVPPQLNFLKIHFHNQFKFLHSPIHFRYAVNELKNKCPDGERLFALHRTEKDRQYTCLNREPRASRITLMHGLRSQGLFREGYISNSMPQHMSPDIIRTQTEYGISVKSDMHNGMILCMLLDEYDISNNKPRYLPFFPEQTWSTYYDIVGETTAPYYIPDPLDLTQVTEKTAKSILSMRPFMINGGPYCLGRLKHLGFKTYDIMFDESYDNKTDIIDRQEIIVNNVKRYTNKYHDLEALMPQVREIASYNRHHILNADYEQLLVNELNSLN